MQSHRDPTIRLDADEWLFTARSLPTIFFLILKQFHAIDAILYYLIMFPKLQKKKLIFILMCDINWAQIPSIFLIL